MSIQQRDLVTFRELPDGNLEATLQRYGRLVVRLPNSAQTLEISVKRDAKKNFRCFVATTVSGEEKQNDAARKANGGVTPEINHILGVDGRLNPTDHEKASTRKQSTGRKAELAAASESSTDSDPGKSGGGDSGDSVNGGDGGSGASGGDTGAPGESGECEAGNGADEGGGEAGA